MDVAGRQPAMPYAPQSGAGLLLSLTLPGSSLYPKDLLLIQLHRLEAREAGATLYSDPFSTTHLLYDLGQVHGIPWLMFLHTSKYH